MADHRAEQIAAAFKTTLTGLTTTGANVHRSRATPLPRADNLRALVIRLGEETVEDQPFNFVGRFLALQVHAYATDAVEANIETALNLMRKEITIALQAAPTLGLAFVIDTREGAVEYELAPDGEQVLGVARTQWLVQYRSSRADPSA